MRNFMDETVQIFINKLCQLIGGSLILEYGLSLWQQRKFLKAKLLATLVLLVGARIAWKFMS